MSDAEEERNRIIKEKIVPPGITMVFADGRSITAPGTLWVAAIVQTMTPTQREQVFQFLDHFKQKAMAVPSLNVEPHIIGGN